MRTGTGLILLSPFRPACSLPAPPFCLQLNFEFECSDLYFLNDSEATRPADESTSDGHLTRHQTSNIRAAGDRLVPWLPGL